MAPGGSFDADDSLPQLDLDGTWSSFENHQFTTEQGMDLYTSPGDFYSGRVVSSGSGCNDCGGKNKILSGLRTELLPLEKFVGKDDFIAFLDTNCSPLPAGPD